MEPCLNCEMKFSPYKLEILDLDAFPSLTDKATSLGYSKIKVCSDCYDKLAASLPTTAGTYHYHPYAGVSD